MRTTKKRSAIYPLSMLAGMVEATVPTQVIAHRMEKDGDPSSPFTAVKADMQTFFRNNPAFHFRTTLIDEYLERTPRDLP